jgi:hypothetical protein
VKRHGCMVTYLLYIVMYFVYFILISKILASMPLVVKSESLLALSLFLSFVLAAITAFVIVNRKRILNLLRPKKET